MTTSPLAIVAVLTTLSTSLPISTTADARNPKKGISFSGAQDCALLEPHTDSSWWYTWGTRNGFTGSLTNFCPDGDAAVAAARASGMDFVPCFWSSVPPQPLEAGVDAELQAAQYLMTFNEPDLSGQANLTPQQAADMWAQVEAIADTYGLEIVGPCMTKDAYSWYDDFLAACTDCRIDYTCIHTYYQPWPCDGSKNWQCIGNESLGDDHWLRWTIDNWHNKYGKDIWVTEYGCYPWEGLTCDPDTHDRIMQQQTAVFEEDPRVYRYNWFTTYAFDLDSFGNGALNVPNYYVSKGECCVSNPYDGMDWTAGIYTPSKGWGIHEYHQCIDAAKAKAECYKDPEGNVAVSIDDDSCYCARSSCDTLVPCQPYFTTYQELGVTGSSLTSSGEVYNSFGTTSTPVPPTPSPPVTPAPTPDPCSISNGGCAQICSSANGVATCSCNEGFALDGDGSTCSNVDDCDPNPCMNGGPCTDGILSYICNCVGTGYQGTHCETDVDECQTGQDNCSANASCTNQPGSFSCACNSGYEGNGVTCSLPPTPSPPLDCTTIESRDTCQATTGCAWSGNPNTGTCGSEDGGGGGDCGTKPSFRKCKSSSECLSCTCDGNGRCA